MIGWQQWKPYEKILVWYRQILMMVFKFMWQYVHFIKAMVWHQISDKLLSKLIITQFTYAYMHHWASVNSLIGPWAM